MKKQIVCATLLAGLSSATFASKARMIALGEDGDRGSSVYSDVRNVFTNPAAMNRFKNMVTLEWGADAKGVASNTDAAPRAEGGLFKDAGVIRYGVYHGYIANFDRGYSDFKFGDAGTTTNTTAGGVTTTTTVNSVTANPANVNDSAKHATPGNSFNLFLAGDAGIEWGVRLQYASQTKKDHNAATTNLTDEYSFSGFGLGFGILMGDLSASSNLTFTDKSEYKQPTVTNSLKGKFGFDLNVAYTWETFTFLGSFETRGLEHTPVSTNTVANDEYTKTIFKFGAAHRCAVAENVSVVTTGKFVMNNQKKVAKTSATASTETKINTTTLPVTVAVEAAATPWLTLRGSVSQSLLINNQKTETTTTPAPATTTAPSEEPATDTVVASGASLKFGDFSVDGLLGLSTAGSAKEGALRFDRLLSRVSLNYVF